VKKKDLGSTFNWLTAERGRGGKRGSTADVKEQNTLYTLPHVGGGGGGKNE